MLSIGFIGDLSSGKSSIINSIARAFIASVSLQRETYNVIQYKFTKDASSKDELAKELDAVHQKNRETRKALSEGKLLNREQINQVVSSHDTSAQNCNIIDFPGFDYNVEKTKYDGYYTQLITRYLRSLNVIFYVVDASKAFMDKKEITFFKKIQKEIIEVNKEYIYPELIVLVNKYDNINDEDLNEIYLDISKKINIPNDKIFRMSSHQILINNIKELYVPEFIRKSEIQKILTNAGVSNISELKPFEIIRKDDIKLIKDIDGDWDNFLGFISKLYEKYLEHLKERLLARIDDWMRRCMEFYSYKNFYFGRTKDEINILKEIEKLYRIYQKYFINDTSLAGIIKGKFEIGFDKIRLQDSNKVNFIVLKEMIANNIFCVYDILNLENILKLRHYSGCQWVNHDILVSIYYHISQNPDLGPDYLRVLNNSNLFLNIFTDPKTYEDLSYEHYDIKHSKWVSGKPNHKGIYNHISWFIDSLANSDKTPSNIRKLVIMTITSAGVLRDYYRDGIISDEMLNKINLDMPLIFRCKIYRESYSRILYHKTFEKDSNAVEYCKYYRHFEQLE